MISGVRSESQGHYICECIQIEAWSPRAVCHCQVHQLWNFVINNGHSQINKGSHSVFSYVTSSTALPTRFEWRRGSFSRRTRHRRVRASIASKASRPTSVLIFLISRSHCFIEAVTASLIWHRREGNEDRRCWKNGVCDNEVGGILWMSSSDYKKWCRIVLKNR